jgi:SecD/SecF fusion protein
MSKGTRIFIVAFTSLIVLLCIYYLSFTFKVNSIEKEAIKIAEQKVKMDNPKSRYPNNELMQFLYEDTVRQERVNYKNRYLDSIQNEKVYLGSTYKQAKEQQLNLGLDLQGGMSVVLQVSLKELLMSMSDDNRDPNFIKALEQAELQMQSSQDDYISLFENAYKKLNPNGKLAPIFATRQYTDRIKFTSSDNDVLKVIREEAASAIQRTYSIITSRIDQFGTKQPTVTLDPNKARITVEIAGVDNPARVRKLLQATANLEFWETYKANQIGNSLNKANDALKVVLGNQKSTTKDTTKNLLDNILESSTTVKDTAKDILGNVGKTKKVDTSQAAKIEEYKTENPLFSIMMPSVDNNNRYSESPMVGYVRALDTALLNQYLSYPEVLDAFPKDIAFMYSLKPLGDQDDPKNKVKFFGVYAIKKGSTDGDAPLDGSAVTDSRKDIDQSGQVVVNMQMNGEGARTWSDLTKRNVGNFVAIAVDNQIVSAPIVNTQIDGGNSVIQGGFTQEEAQDLSNMLKIGKLPASAKIIEEELVGPSLGEQSIRAGLIALGASILLIFIFMMVFYSSGGLIASLMMILNLFLIIGLMAGLPFGFTLTLPGIAGLVLTLGMAVDANVIIYERIKEEIRAGKTLIASMQDGFKHSLAAIIDGNITTLITGLILGIIGMGPITGFAVTLCIGILTTLFTAVLLTKLFVDFQADRGKTYNYVTSYTQNFLQGHNFDFIGKRKISYIISSTVIVLGIISMFTKGFDLGIDFEGGREYRVRFEKPVNSSEIRNELDKVLGNGTVVKQFGAANQVKVTTKYLIKKNNKETDEKVEKAVYNGLKKYLGNTTYENFKIANVLSSTKVDPSISVDFRNSSIKATIFSLIAIFIYILIRFRKYGYSVGAVAATLHDALIVVCLFSILHGILPFPLEVDQTFIAAILTIIGYSINDTVIIFDRLREYLSENPKANMKDTMNAAINSTLSRTFNTAFTVFIVVFILFLFGGSVLKAFSFAMLLGVVVGIYSSVFIASPIMYDLDKGKSLGSHAPEVTVHHKKKK